MKQKKGSANSERAVELTQSEELKDVKKDRKEVQIAQGTPSTSSTTDYTYDRSSRRRKQNKKGRKSVLRNNKTKTSLTCGKKQTSIREAPKVPNKMTPKRFTPRHIK